MIGTAAPPLRLKEWLNFRPLEIFDLRGKVALLRWWTAGCPYCAATAQALIDHVSYRLDGDWAALKRWWLTRERAFTSVSFLIDQDGIIRYVRPGGEFHEGQQGGMPTHEACNRDMHFIQREIAKLLNV